MALSIIHSGLFPESLKASATLRRLVTFLRFASLVAFPEKPTPAKQQPLFGPFKKGDPLHTGYNKAIGGHGRTSEDMYMEEMEEDKVQYRKNVTTNVWRGVTGGQTMINSTTINNFRNVNRERSNIF